MGLNSKANFYLVVCIPNKAISLESLSVVLSLNAVKERLSVCNEGFLDHLRDGKKNSGLNQSR